MTTTNKVGQNPQPTGAISGVSQKDVIEFGHTLGFTVMGIFLMNDEPQYAAPHLTSILHRRYEA